MTGLTSNRPGVERGGSGPVRTADILVADDCDGYRMLIRVLLDRSEYRGRVKAFAGGRELWRYLSENRDGLDPRHLVIVSDLHMPDGDGFKLLHAIRNDPLFGPVPVIFHTADDGSFVRARALACGCAGVAVKQPDIEALLGVIAAVRDRQLKSGDKR